MSRAILMPALGAAAMLAGLALLLRRARTPDAPSAYALRIAGAMLFALGLFLGGFALALNLTP